MSFRFLGILLLSLATLQGQERQPVALAYDAETKHLLVANRAFGSVTIVDTVAHQPIRELSIGTRLSSIASIPQTSRFLVTDEEAHELLLLQNGEIRTRLPMPKFPVQVRVSADGSIATVTSLWSRCVSIIDIEETELQRRTTIPLDFAPREQAFLPDQADLFIGDAFGGQVAVMPLDAKGPLDFRTRSIPAHNIRGLAVLPGTGTLAVSHQRLNALGQTTIGDIHWGNLLGNHLRYLNMQSSTNQALSITRDSWRRDLGGPSNGAGDPGPIASLLGEKLAVCLTGVHAVDIVDIETDIAQRIPVGKGPSAICLIPETNLAFVANRFSDSLTLIDTKEAKALKQIPLHEAPPPQPVRSVANNSFMMPPSPMMVGSAATVVTPMGIAMVASQTPYPMAAMEAPSACFPCGVSKVRNPSRGKAMSGRLKSRSTNLSKARCEESVPSPSQNWWTWPPTYAV